jgi:hypothetical protein
MRSHPVSGSQQSANSPASAVSAPACDSKWNQVSSANQGVYGTRLFSVSAISPTAAWAVGDYVNVAGIRLSVVEYWDGSTWTVPAAQPAAVGAGDNSLASVTALASDNVWAVGFSRANNTTPDNALTLIEHYDGTSWTQVASPNLALAANALFGVKSLATNDIWAVGEAKASSTSSQGLIEHYDGTTWTIKVGAPTHGLEVLFDALPLAANDVWAVGQGSNGGATYPLLEHWDGTAWTVPPYVTVGLPPTGTAIAYNDIAGVQGDMWIVGWGSTGAGAFTFAQHYDGQAWTIASPPSPGQNDQLIGVRYTANNDVWAFGSTAYSGGGTSSELDHSLVEHWDGKSWSQVPSPNPLSDQVLFDGAFARSVVSQSQILAVGFSQDIITGGAPQTLAAVLCEPRPEITSVLPTQGPARGGNAVTIYGSGLSFPRSVTFGNVPASSYTVNSDTQITAIAPPQPIGTTVVVSVTTMGGDPSAFGNDQYAYVGSAGQWQDHGGVLASGPTAVTSGSGHVDAFARGTDNQIWHLDVSHNMWEPLSGLIVTSDAAAVSTGTGTYAVFVRGSDNALWRNDFNGTAWTAWAKLGGILAGAPAVVSPSAGTLDVFVEGIDKRLYYDNITATSSAWYGVGGMLAGPPSAVRASNGNADALVIGTDGQLWHWNGSSSGPYGRWVGAGGRLAGPPALTSSYDGTIDALVEGTDGRLWHWYDNVFDAGNWELVGGRLGAAPVATSWGNGRLDVAVRGSDGGLWHAWRSPRGGWSWEGLGGIIVGPPAIVAKDLYLLDILARGGDNRLWHLPFS